MATRRRLCRDSFSEEIAPILLIIDERRHRVLVLEDVDVAQQAVQRPAAVDLGGGRQR